MTDPTDFGETRLDVLELLTLAQDRLVATKPDGAVERRGKQDTLSLIAAAKAELRKADMAVAS